MTNFKIRLTVAATEVDLRDDELLPFLLEHEDELPKELAKAVEHVLEGRADAKRLVGLVLNDHHVSVYDIIPDFGSYLSDTERNLRMDDDEWVEFEENPAPYIVDILLDFGLWAPFDTEPEVVRQIATRAANHYCHAPAKFKLF